MTETERRAGILLLLHASAYLMRYTDPNDREAILYVMGPLFLELHGTVKNKNAEVYQYRVWKEKGNITGVWIEERKVGFTPHASTRG